MNYFFYKLLYKQHFLNSEGIKLFADRCLNKYVGKTAIKKANILTTYVRILNDERTMREKEFLVCSKSDRMDDASFAIKRKHSKAMMTAVYFAIIIEIFLNYVSTLVFIQGDGLIFVIFRWGLSILLAILAMLTTDGLLSKMLPEESVRIKGTESKIDDDLYYSKTANAKRVISLVLLPLLLIGVEWAIIGVSRKRALDIEGGQSGDVLYYGFILLAVVLPLLAGYFKWDSKQHGKIYQNTLKYHKTQKLIHVLDLAIISTMKDIKDVVDNSIRKSWRVFDKFKLYKENFNSLNNIPKENTTLHYCNSIETFTKQAITRFGVDVTNILNELEINQKR